MKLLPTLLVATMFLLSLGACNNSGEGMKIDLNDSTTLTLGDSGTGEPTALARQWMKTASMRFRVKDLQEGTLALEKLVATHGGFLTGSTLDRRVEEQTLERISADSNEERTTYTLEADMTFRVPAEELDSTLRQINGMAEILDHREIIAEDASLALLSTQLAKQRLDGSSQELHHLYDKGQARLKEATAAHQVVATEREQGEAALLKSYELHDRVMYSDVHLQLYQRKAMRTERLAITAPLPPYETPFPEKLSEAFTSGLAVIPDLLLFLAKYWLPLTALASAIFVLKRKGFLKVPATHNP